MKTTGILTLLISMAAALPLAAQAPTFDTSGDGQLNGTYYFRQVLYGVSGSADESGIVGDISQAIAVYGNITFDGNGHYSITNAAVNDSYNEVSADPLSCYLAGSICPSTQSTPVAGSYAVSSSGFGFIANPISEGDLIYGLVAGNGIFSGSTTESTQAFNDLFIAAPLPSPLPTGFNGSYTVVGFQPGQDFAFTFSPGSGGNGGTVGISGYQEGYGDDVITQSSNVTYTFSSGAGVIKFPTSNTAAFISGGQEFVYFSRDGNFFFGGNQYGYDMILGVANSGSGNPNFGACNGGSGCLFYQAGVDEDFSQLASGYADLDGYFGSLNATNTGTIIAHERLSDLIFDNSTYGFAYTDTFTYPVSGSYTDSYLGAQYWVGDGGAVRIGQGIGPFLGISLAFQAPSFTPTGSVYINPAGIVSAASFTPFTAGVSNGEFISIFGSNLAPATEVETVPYPTSSKNGVQVLVNGNPMPLYFVSSSQIDAIFPSGYPYSLAPIQVVNNGTISNSVQMVLGAPGAAPADVATPGIFTNPLGSGYAAAVDTNNGYSIVTESNPAQPGDIVEVFMSGLGQVYPTVPDGTPPPISPLSYTVNTVGADLDGTTATVGFAGLTPTIAGLYQVNVTIPTTTAAGDHFLDISVNEPTTNGPLVAYASQVVIPVGGGAAARSEVRPMRRRARTAHPAAFRKQPFRSPFSRQGSGN